jgi:Xaa-Pro aminopeptidase
MTKPQAIAAARRAQAAADRALERFHDSLRQASEAGATRRELADAVGLSPSRVQQIVSPADDVAA